MRWLVLALLCGCTSTNPLYLPSGPSTTELGLVGVVDLTVASITDSGVTTPTVDMATPPQCTGTQRSCDTTGSEVCQSGMYVADRTCPAASTCSNGFCAEPALARSCELAGNVSETLCGAIPTSSTDSCQPFVQANGTVAWVCDTPVGTGTPDNACKTGATCRSGICAMGSCFRACSQDADCPKQGGASKCTDVQIVIEGVQIKTRTCSK